MAREDGDPPLWFRLAVAAGILAVIALLGFGLLLGTGSFG
jgi:hypothetical protein